MNGYPHIETERDYSKYEEAVRSFFEREGIGNLTAEIGEDGDHECVICHEVVGCDPFFSWRGCECCGRNLGGDRYHASGYNAEAGEAYCYEVCVDCIYYAEYSRLDDMTMMGLEED